MKEALGLFIFIDACGWEIIRNDPFVQSMAPHRRRLRSVFGYSSTCVPSILSGRWPVEHRNWCFFVYDPLHSPFRHLRWLRWVPQAISSRRRFRRVITRLVKKQMGFKGYFDLYNIPFQYIHLYDFSEKKSPLKPGGMNVGSNIFDFLIQKKIAFASSDPDLGEWGNRDVLSKAIREEAIDFGFLYWPALDGLLHEVGNQSPQISAKLRDYDQWIADLHAEAQRHYREVRLYVFSDHGMANCTVHLDLKRRIESTGLRFGKDYVVVYDSTMARFWCFHQQAREVIEACLKTVEEGRIVPDQELEQLRTLFPDRYFGELIFLVKEGVLIVPSHMGERPITAMHGYHPDEPQSYASLCTNVDSLAPDIQAIPDIYKLMTQDALWAGRKNGTLAPGS